MSRFADIRHGSTGPAGLARRPALGAAPRPRPPEDEFPRRDAGLRKIDGPAVTSRPLVALTS